MSNKELEHWDIVVLFDLDYFQAQITRYLFRWKEKGGLEDLLEAQHYLQKYIEVHRHYCQDDTEQTLTDLAKQMTNMAVCSECGHLWTSHNETIGCVKIVMDSSSMPVVCPCQQRPETQFTNNQADTELNIPPEHCGDCAHSWHGSKPCLAEECACCHPEV
jgi:hypothetical protein